MLCVQGNARLGEIGHPQLMDARGGNVVDRRARHVCFIYASSGCKAGRRDVGVAHGQPCRGRGGMSYIDSVRSREFVFALFDYEGMQDRWEGVHDTATCKVCSFGLL